MPIRSATDASIAEAARILRAGGLVAFPTETVYGVGADATNARAIADLYATKGRPRFNPLISHVADAESAWRLGQPNAVARSLAAAFWPGPLTLVLTLQPASGVADLTLAGLSTIAVRVPKHPIATALLKATGRPVAAPSANRSGRVSPTDAQHVQADFAGIDLMIIDGGPTEVGVESTIVDVSGVTPTLLRPGGIDRADLERIIGMPLAAAEVHADGALAPVAPGQLESHYAPRAAVRLEAATVREGEALLAFGTPPAHNGPVLNLSPTRNLVEAATRLFAGLRALDDLGAETIAVMPIPHWGLGEAINDRLRRAAAPRVTPRA